MKVYPEETKQIGQLFQEVVMRLSPDCRRKVNDIHAIVVDDQDYRAMLGNTKHVAQAIRRTDGWGVVFNVALARWPAGAARYIILHELGHVVLETEDEEMVDRFCLSTGLGSKEDMHQAAMWAELIAANPENQREFHPTQVMREVMHDVYQ